MKRLAFLGLAALALAAPAAWSQNVPMDQPLEAEEPVLYKQAFDRGIDFNQRVGALATRHGFRGELGMAAPGTQVYGAQPALPGGSYRPGLWRWASVTKQITAILIMQEVAAGRITLDQPVARYLPRFASPGARQITVRQLLRHQSGLPNTDRADGAYHRPVFAGSRSALTGYCAGPLTAPPGGSWSYNNCDYIVAGALLQSVTGKPWAQLVRERISVPLALKSVGTFPTRLQTVPGFDRGQPEPNFDLASYGASGALYGSINDLLTLDMALLSGGLLPQAQLDEMWDGQADLGFVALGQWSFAVPLKGCATPVRIVERRGAIGGVQVRNFILPEQQTAVVAFTDRGEFEFGEVWQGSGFAHDLLSLAACRQEEP